MRKIEKVINEIENCIRNNSFKELEDDKLELKDNSHNATEWKEVYKSACAFLNTSGGIIVIGIKEDKVNKKFIVTGFDKRNEDKAKAIRSKFLTEDSKNTDLNIYVYGFELLPILEKEILVIFIDPLPEDNKYVYLDGVAYERLLTGDHKIPENKISAQKDYKLELQNAKELRPIIGVGIEELDLNKLNDYIHILNKETFTESIKSDLESSKSFLVRKGFITKTFEPTILGALVCSKNVEDILGNKSQIDCYVDSGINIAENKKILKDNILQIMEKALSFVIQNIKVGVAPEAGGVSIPEYPIRLLRESINNSLAHRDYGISKFSNINIVPNRHIEIRNPGRFKKELILEDLSNEVKIRRIIPGNSKPNNPKLAEILKIHDKFEGRSLGMSTLTNECLANNIDLPYYKFHSNDDLSLFIRKGRLYDEKMETLINAYEGYIEKKLNGDNVSLEQKLVLSYYYKSEIENNNDRYTIVLTKDNNHLDAVNSLEAAGLIIKHPISNQLNSVFILDRNLFKDNFNTELRKMFGADFDALSKEGKSILTCIYELNTFSKNNYPNANIIGNSLWNKAGKSNTILGFETFKRSVRNQINQMVKRGVLVKLKDKPAYHVNENFNIKQSSIYD
jgi:ATP-dependent DNA helicase RecG